MILFPLVVVLTQDCDLEQQYSSRFGAQAQQRKNEDKWLISVLVAPLYNLQHVYLGEHLSKLELNMTPVPERGSAGDFLRTNRRPRYHYLEFAQGVPIVASVVDFKHYFSVSAEYLREAKRERFVCSVSQLFREEISRRFSSFLSRIGLPDIESRDR